MVRKVSEGFAGVSEKISFRGHPKILALHPKTIEVTTVDYLTPEGDCIVGVAADKGCKDLSDAMKSALKRDGAVVKFRIVVGTRSFEFRGEGDSGLLLTHQHDLVIRKSSFLSDRTLAVRCTASALDIPRDMVAMLRNPETKGYLELEVL